MQPLPFPGNSLFDPLLTERCLWVASHEGGKEFPVVGAGPWRRPYGWLPAGTESPAQLGR